MGCGGSQASAPQSASKPAAESTNTLANTLAGQPSQGQQAPAEKAPAAQAAQATDKDARAKDSDALLTHAGGLREGEEAISRTNGQRGIVLNRTTTDVLLSHADGTQVWHDVDDVAQAAVMAAAHNVCKDDVVALLLKCAKGSAKGIVLQRTTTEVQLRMDDGTEEWHAVEEIAHILPEAHGVKKGDEVVQLACGSKGIVQERTTTDVLVRMADGSEQWCGLEDVAKSAVQPTPSPAQGGGLAGMMVMQALQEAENRKEKATGETEKAKQNEVDEAPNQRKDRSDGCCW